jgi:hypothetical protein
MRMRFATPFLYVSHMNEAFGNPKGNPKDYTLIAGGADAAQYNETAWARLANQCANIGGRAGERVSGEVEELFVALAARDVEATRDALCDIMVFALGGYHFLGYDADQDMNAVLDGVMTRFCKDQDELTKTCAYWAERGITDVYTQGVFPMLCIKAARNQTATNGEVVPKGKFLKSVGYRQTVFPPAPEPRASLVSPDPARRYFGARPLSEASAPQRRKDDIKEA